MKRNTLLLIIILLIGAIGAHYCMMEKSEDYQTVRFRGAAQYANMSKSDIFVWVNINQDSIAALTVSHNDLIGLFSEEDVFFYRYLITDGTELIFKRNDYKIFLNDQLITLIITDDVDQDLWFNEVKELSLNNLRSIQFRTDSIPFCYDWLTKTADINPNIGLVFEYEMEGSEEVIPLFDPTWIFLYDYSLSPEIREQIQQMKNLDVLCISASIDELNDLITLPKLQHLVITDMPLPEKGTMLQLNRKVKSLTLIRPEITNLDFLENAIHLKELNIIEGDALYNIQGIKKLENLEVINFKGCDTLVQVGPLDQLPSPLWLSLPVNTSQNDFEKILENYKDLEVVELVDCDSIHDLSPVSKLENLECLTVSDMKIDIESLYDLNNLNYLSIPESMCEDSVTMVRLSEKLPNTTIVFNSGGGMCLGKGWLFLIFPMIIFVYLMFSMTRKIKSRR